MVHPLTIEDAYEAAQTYQDLCDINVKFLQGIYDHTAYHCGPVCDETIPLLGDLCRLNALGMYTFNGQPAKSTFHQTELALERRDNSIKALWCHQQRPYLEGFVENKHVYALKTYLDAHQDAGVLYFIEYPDGVVNSTICCSDKSLLSGRQVYPLHREAYIMTGGFTMTQEAYTHILPTIDGWTKGFGAVFSDAALRIDEEKDLHMGCGVKPCVLDDIACIVLTTRDFNMAVSLEKLMIDFFEGLKVEAAKV